MWNLSKYMHTIFHRSMSWTLCKAEERVPNLGQFLTGGNGLQELGTANCCMDFQFCSNIKIS